MTRDQDRNPTLAKGMGARIMGFRCLRCSLCKTDEQSLKGQLKLGCFSPYYLQVTRFHKGRCHKRCKNNVIIREKFTSEHFYFQRPLVDCSQSAFHWLFYGKCVFQHFFQNSLAQSILIYLLHSPRVNRDKKSDKGKKCKEYLQMTSISSSTSSIR